MTFVFFTLFVNIVTLIYSSKLRTLNKKLNKLCCGGNGRLEPVGLEADPKSAQQPAF